LEQQSIEKTFRLYRRAFLAVVCVTLVLFVGVAVERYKFETHVVALSSNRVSAEKYIGVSIYLDELLTMSARMASTTAEPRWTARYNDNLAKFDEATNILMTLAPIDIGKKYKDATAVSAAKVAAMETDAFERIGKGDKTGAQAIFDSESYKEQHDVFIMNANEFMSSLQGSLEAELATLRKRWYAVLGFLAAGLLLAGAAWFYLARAMNRTIAFLGNAEAMRIEREADQQRLRLQEETAEEQAKRIAEAQRVSKSVAEFSTTAEVTFDETLRGIGDLRQSTKAVYAMVQTANVVTENLTTSSASMSQLIASGRSRFEDLNAALLTLVHDMRGSNELSSTTAADASEATKAVHELSDRIRSIGAIVDMISSIADQTNLLALNATIEAARAGEAGRGFAVVANEVKSLAQQTRTSTEAITNTVKDIDFGMTHVVTSMDKVFTSMEEVVATADKMTLALDNQRASSVSILEDFESAANFAVIVSDEMARVGTTNRDTSTAASSLDAATEQLSASTIVLHQSMSEFLSKVRAA
jgi:methyl-accepting chemotaxis protein